MKTLSVVVMLLILTRVVNAQEKWERYYGGSNYDCGYSVQQTNDGGYIVAGVYDGDGGNGYIYLFKINATGDTIWTKTYGEGDGGIGYCVQQTTDGGYIITGQSRSYPNQCAFLIKTNAMGDTLWSRNYSGYFSGVGRFVQQTTDGGYIVVTHTGAMPDFCQVHLIKTNVAGDTLWTRDYSPHDTIQSIGFCVRQTADAGYVITGLVEASGTWKVYLVKTNASGDTAWTRQFDGNMYQSSTVQQTSDGGYIIAGTYEWNGSNCQVYLIKTYPSGDTLWTRMYGGAEGDWGYSVEQTQDGGYIVAGHTNCYGNNTQVYLLRINSDGDTLWTRTYGGGGDDKSYCVQQTTDGGFIIAGETSSFGDGWQVYLIKTDSLGNVGIDEDRMTNINNDHSVATVFRGSLQLPADRKCKVFDIMGRMVEPGSMKPGVYFIEIDGVMRQKVVKIR